jgi:hypothetical protein
LRASIKVIDVVTQTKVSRKNTNFCGDNRRDIGTIWNKQPYVGHKSMAWEIHQIMGGSAIAFLGRQILANFYLRLVWA